LRSEVKLSLRVSAHQIRQLTFVLDHEILRQVVLMVDVLRSFEPLTLPRPRGAHRYDVFSLRLGRLTLYRRGAFEAWLMLEADPAAKTFCERPGFMTIDGRRCIVDFWVRSDDHECLVVLSETAPATDRPQSRLDFDPEAFTVRHIDAAERAAARVWTVTGSACCLYS
jgi:hypothetical protein